MALPPYVARLRYTFILHRGRENGITWRRYYSL